MNNLLFQRKHNYWLQGHNDSAFPKTPLAYPQQTTPWNIVLPFPVSCQRKSFIKIRQTENAGMKSGARCRPSKSLAVQRKHCKTVIELDPSNASDYSRHTAKEETKNTTENDNFKNSSDLISSTNKVGEDDDSDRSEYIKAIFEVTKVDRKSNKVVKLTKHRHIISHWEHIHEKYYAKGMCKKCYFSKGQTK